MSWYHHAACQNQDPELFFPIGNTGPALLQLEQAKHVCAGCPVQSLCLEWSLLAGIDHGVWGGVGEEERRALRRRAVWQGQRIFEPSRR
jgi:WhiB family transcriptional regulator, redox-sensing transcriptional regulator